MTSPALFSALGFLAPIVLLLALWIVAGRAARRGESVSFGLQLTAALVPPLVVGAVLAASAARFGDLRVSLEGLRFAFDPSSPRTVSVGGSAESDHLVVPGLPAGFLTFASQGQEIRLEIHPEDTAQGNGDVGDPSDPSPHRALGALRTEPLPRPLRCRFGLCAKPPLWNTIELHDQDRFEVTKIGALTFDTKGTNGQSGPRFVGPEGSAPRPTFPSRSGAFGLPIGRELPPELAIYPLRDYGSPDPARPLLGAGGAPIGAFVSRDGGYFRRDVFLTLTESGSRVVSPSSSTPFEFRSNVATLRPGDTIALALYRVDLEEPELAAKGPQGFFEHLRAVASGGERLHPPSRVQERRSLRLRYERSAAANGSGEAQGFLRLDFDTPTFVQVQESDLAELRRRAANALEASASENGDGPTPKALLSLTPERFALYAGEGEMLLSFAALGEPLGAELFSRIEPPLETGPRKDLLRVVTHSGIRDVPLGEAFPIGEESAAILRVARLGAPWGAIALVAAVTLAAAFGRGASGAARLRFLPFVVLSGMETLLAIRVLIGYEGAYLDAGSAPAAWKSLAVFALVPFAVRFALFVAERRSMALRGEQPPTYPPPISATPPALGGGTRDFGELPARSAQIQGEETRDVGSLPARSAQVPPPWEGGEGRRGEARRGAAPEHAPSPSPRAAWGRVGVVGYALLTFAATAIALFRAGTGPLGIAFACGGTLAVSWLLGHFGFPLLDRLFAAADRDGGAKALRIVFWVTAAFLATRLITLFGFGWKERIDLGPRFAVSIVYVPWALLAIALAWRQRGRWRGVFVIAALLLLLFLAVPLMARDLGSILLFSLPPILLLALPLFEERGPGLARRALLALPLALAVIVFAFLPALPSWRSFPTFEEARASPAKAEELVAKKVAVKRNELRFWSRLAPEQLARFGTTESEGFLTVMENLRAYAARGPFGEGYLAVPLSAPLAQTQLNDNLSAVHLLGPFGGLGAFAVLALFAGWIFASILGNPAAADFTAPRALGLAALDRLKPREAWGLMLLWTLSLAAIYMMSANIELLLFTGKNLYFLAASSLSDAVEGALLVALALWALAPREKTDVTLSAPDLLPVIPSEGEEPNS